MSQGSKMKFIPSLSMYAPSKHQKRFWIILYHLIYRRKIDQYYTIMKLWGFVVVVIALAAGTSACKYAE